MSSINATVVPWLIAEFGIHFGDWGNVETAMPMITHVIVSQQLGGYTARTYPGVLLQSMGIASSKWPSQNLF